MKNLKIFFLLVFSFILLAGSAAQAQTEPTPKKGWSNKAKGAAVGGGAGAVTGAVIGGGKGAIIGGAAGAVGGGILGRKRDKKRDPARYNEYRNKKK
ncbi:YMGG-like glycine zipper-containing protein [Hymenobacter arizonensis]|uniref:Glycine-zipper containing OmpA-like membrane domain-containing protein n=1 Tax=Hymenobacter arizonensis TaxID=1227077 RepID=A0A1I6AJX1_HYMAR|nr:YMGG-like glycine zipper-containing protein [Hymenobacter arizonensis]SFQ69011.1 Glycine-zipper containing OmpA-like membrane domain-containing protein [Hymenobacter arizonensis]